MTHQPNGVTTVSRNRLAVGDMLNVSSHTGLFCGCFLISKGILIPIFENILKSKYNVHPLSSIPVVKAFISGLVILNEFTYPLSNSVFVGLGGAVGNKLISHLLGWRFEPWTRHYVGKLVTGY